MLQFSVFELPAILVQKLLQLILGDPAIIVDVDAAGGTAQEGKTEEGREGAREGEREIERQKDGKGVNPCRKQSLCTAKELLSVPSP